MRGLNAYGDPSKWTTGADATHSVLAFFKVTKYPPSLHYVLATLGIVLGLAPLVERVTGPLGRMFHTFGRTPLFTYLAHLYVVHGLALLIGVAIGVPASLFAGGFGNDARLASAGWGFSLPATYLVWVAVVLALWPLAAWYAAIKQRRGSWWLAFL